jgi:hypothetical protein
MYASCSKQLSHSLLGAFDPTISRPTPIFSLRIAASAALDHGVYGSVCFSQMPDSRHLRRDIPMTCSCAPSIIIVFGAPSRRSNRDNPLYACDFFDMGKALHQPSAVANICAHLLLRLEVVFENNVLVKQSLGGVDSVTASRLFENGGTASDGALYECPFRSLP